jgi:hypothetical protein
MVTSAPASAGRPRARSARKQQLCKREPGARRRRARAGRRGRGAWKRPNEFDTRHPGGAPLRPGRRRRRRSARYGPPGRGPRGHSSSPHSHVYGESLSGRQMALQNDRTALVRAGHGVEGRADRRQRLRVPAHLRAGHSMLTADSQRMGSALPAPRRGTGGGGRAWPNGRLTARTHHEGERPRSRALAPRPSPWGQQPCYARPAAHRGSGARGRRTLTPPETGASTMGQPRAAAAAATVRETSGAIVDESTSSVPGVTCASSPPSPWPPHPGSQHRTRARRAVQRRPVVERQRWGLARHRARRPTRRRGPVSRSILTPVHVPRHTW